MGRNALFVLLSCLVTFAPACSSGDHEASEAKPAGDCERDSDCDDGNVCTRSVCRSDGSCSQEARTGEPCDDDDACTVGETCGADGACGSGAAVEMPDDPCSVCSCDPEGGVSCSPRAPGEACDDGSCCTTGETCRACDAGEDEGCGDSGLVCVGEEVVCDDGDGCTADECVCGDAGEQSCTYDPAPDGSACDFDPNDCTLGDTCKAGVCVKAEPLPLDDGNPCTLDLCVKGKLEHKPELEGQCDDANECTTGDRCFLGNCVGGEPVECVVEACASSASCVPGQGCVSEWKPVGAECDDQNQCTLEDSCDEERLCASEKVRDCNDGNPCTEDSCDPEVGCVNAFTPELDGAECPGGDACQPSGCVTGECVGGEALDCDDGDPCTEDSCDLEQGCVHDRVPDQTTGEVTCSQKNDVDDDGCCCFIPDPTGAHKSGSVLDMGLQAAGTVMECCIKPGFSAGCEDTAFFDTSVDGITWDEGLSFVTSSVPDGGSWEDVCEVFAPEVEFRYVRGANDRCYVDFFRCSFPCGDSGEETE